MSELLIRNLELIEKHSSPETYEAVIGADEKLSPVVVHAEADREPEFHISVNGRNVLLHSRRRPCEEAARVVLEWSRSRPQELSGLTVAFALGGMYHLEALIGLLKPGSTLFVADLNPAAFKRALHYCDLSRLTSHEEYNVCFSVNEDPERIAYDFHYKLKEQSTIKTEVFIPPFVKRVFPRVYDGLLDAIKLRIGRESMDRSTVAYLNGEWLQHALVNLPELFVNAPISALKDRFVGATAYVVAAGPSLDRSLEHLKKHADNGLVFAVGNALKPLLEAGIKPDFIVAIDSDPKIMRQYEGVDVSDMYLLTTPSVLPELWNLFRGRIFVFSTNAIIGFNSYLKMFGVRFDPLIVGGTVAVTTIDAAIYCGCENVVLTGLDLAYREDGTTHATKTMYDGRRSCGGTLVEVAGNYRERVLTTKQFSLYIDILNSYLDRFKGGRIKIFNATSDGARFRHVSLIRPEDIGNVPVTGLMEGKRRIISELCSTVRLKPEETFETGFERTMEELEAFAQNSDFALEICDLILKSDENSKVSGKLIRELDRLDQKIREKNGAMMLMIGALEAVFMDIRQRLDEAGADDDALEAVRQSKVFYTNVKGVAEWVMGLMEITIMKYKTIIEDGDQ